MDLWRIGVNRNVDDRVKREKTQDGFVSAVRAQAKNISAGEYMRAFTNESVE